MSAALRPLTVADIDAVARLERELFGRSAWSVAMVREELTTADRWYVGLDDADPRGVGPVGSARGGGLLGYAGASFDGEVVEVMTIGVATRAQRRGLGAQLLAALMAQATTLGAAAVMLEVRVDNDPAIALYERAGFVVLGRRRRYYQPEDVDAFTMRAILQRS